MKKTFVDVLLELPVDTTLQTFLVANGLPLPDDLSWSDGQEVTQTVIEAIRSWPDEIARDQLIAKLMAKVVMSSPSGSSSYVSWMLPKNPVVDSRWTIVLTSPEDRGNCLFPAATSLPLNGHLWICTKPCWSR